MTGTVVWFDSKRGYGFLRRDDGGKEVFVHHSSIDMEGYRQLREGQAVQFEIIDGRKGPQADSVRVIGG